MSFDLANHPGTVQLLQQAADRLVQIVDDEESCHLAIGARLFGLSQDADPAALAELVESLQYFDRMQQRTRYVVQLIEHLVAGAQGPADLAGRLTTHSDKAPFHDDGVWLAGLLGETDETGNQAALS